jgi:hypothetical protein
VAAEHAGEVFADYVKEQIDLEDRRRASLEARGSGVITVSGTLVTLLFAFSAVVTRTPGLALPGVLKVRLTWALIAFAVSSLIAIGTLIPLALHTVDAARLAPVLRNRWDGTVDEALKTTTATRVADLASLQRVNTVKSMLLVAAVAVQVVAVALLVWAVTGLLGWPSR